MSAMDEMLKNMLTKMLGAHMPQILEQLQTALSEFNELKAQMTRIENKLDLIMSGGHSISERIQMGLNIIQDTPEQTIPQMLAHISDNGAVDNAPGSYDNNGNPAEFGSGIISG